MPGLITGRSFSIAVFAFSCREVGRAHNSPQTTKVPETAFVSGTSRASSKLLERKVNRAGSIDTGFLRTREFPPLGIRERDVHTAGCTADLMQEVLVSIFGED